MSELKIFHKSFHEGKYPKGRKWEELMGQNGGKESVLK